MKNESDREKKNKDYNIILDVYMFIEGADSEIEAKEKAYSELLDIQDVIFAKCKEIKECE